MRCFLVLTSGVLLGAVSFIVAAESVAADATPAKSREFMFTYQTTVTGLEPGKTARIWLPVPPSNDDQTVKYVRRVQPSGTMARTDKEPKYGNEILYLETRADQTGQASVAVTYHVLRKEIKADVKPSAGEQEMIDLFLKADNKVPVGGKALALLDGKRLPDDQVELGRVLYDAVNSHMRYSKEGTGWGQGDSNWACDSKYGNCSDFHSLFISLARAKKLPAKFEMGFPLPDARGEGDIPGYHCWAKFKPDGKGWVPVDISEANKNPKMKDYYFGNLTENRIAFSTGRDITLVPKQDGPPLNFFVYPYVEVDGKPYAGDKVQRKFGYKDMAP